MISEEVRQKVMSKEWWEANNSFLEGIYKGAYDRFSKTYSSETSIFYEIRKIAYENEDIKKRGISKDEIDAWELARWRMLMSL